MKKWKPIFISLGILTSATLFATTISCNVDKNIESQNNNTNKTEVVNNPISKVIDGGKKDEDKRSTNPDKTSQSNDSKKEGEIKKGEASTSTQKTDSSNKDKKTHVDSTPSRVDGSENNNNKESSSPSKTEIASETKNELPSLNSVRDENGKYANINPHIRAKDVVLDTENNEYDPNGPDAPKAPNATASDEVLGSRVVTDVNPNNLNPLLDAKKVEIDSNEVDNNINSKYISNPEDVKTDFIDEEKDPNATASDEVLGSTVVTDVDPNNLNPLLDAKKVEIDSSEVDNNINSKYISNPEDVKTDFIDEEKDPNGPDAPKAPNATASDEVLGSRVVTDVDPNNLNPLLDAKKVEIGGEDVNNNINSDFIKSPEKVETKMDAEEYDPNGPDAPKAPNATASDEVLGSTVVTDVDPNNLNPLLDAKKVEIGGEDVNNNINSDFIKSPEKVETKMDVEEKDPNGPDAPKAPNATASDEVLGSTVVTDVDPNNLNPLLDAKKVEIGGEDVNNNINSDFIKSPEKVETKMDVEEKDPNGPDASKAPNATASDEVLGSTVVTDVDPNNLNPLLDAKKVEIGGEDVNNNINSDFIKSPEKVETKMDVEGKDPNGPDAPKAPNATASDEVLGSRVVTDVDPNNLNPLLDAKKVEIGGEDVNNNINSDFIKSPEKVETKMDVEEYDPNGPDAPKAPNATASDEVLGSTVVTDVDPNNLNPLLDSKKVEIGGEDVNNNINSDFIKSPEKVETKMDVEEKDPNAEDAPKAPNATASDEVLGSTVVNDVNPEDLNKGYEANKFEIDSTEIDENINSNVIENPTEVEADLEENNKNNSEEDDVKVEDEEETKTEEPSWMNSTVVTDVDENNLNPKINGEEIEFELELDEE
ncbi:hypothetical protein [Mycoplasmopsis edwardii]|uniref:Uncharacterized protein n=1 Tax=Mycoplasmopsis edwardii TaxID=53558 RepID=A0ACD4PI46_9BACT|nr:hypothetical protein [Mycoplasmopsis edwardii]WBP84359.1 hypothetical protein Me_995_000342 [Mycoplasmopsis edwardii]